MSKFFYLYIANTRITPLPGRNSWEIKIPGPILLCCYLILRFSYSLSFFVTLHLVVIFVFKMSATFQPRVCRTAERKLEIIKYAEEHGNCKAANYYKCSESSVRDWRKIKSVLQAMPKQKRARRGGKVKWPDVEEELVIWIKSLRARAKAANGS
jgi:hypothetical protein